MKTTMEALRGALFCAVYILVFACFNNSVSSSALDVPCNSRSPCLLVASEKKIIALDYNNDTIYPIISKLNDVYTIDYHYSLGYIFWSEISNIKRSSNNGTNINVLLHKTGSCHGLAVDRISSQLYWTDRLYSTISVSDLDGYNTRVLYSSLVEPAGIVLDPEHGLMFWAPDYGNQIKKSTLNGTRIVTLVTNIHGSPGLDLDRQNKLVFWADHFGTIESVDYDGNNKKLLYRGSSIYDWYFVTFFSSYLFVSNGSSSGTPWVVKLNASNGAVTSSVSLPDFGKLWGLVAYDIFQQLPAVTCPTLSTPTHGVLLGCDTTEMLYDTVCRFSCKNGSPASGSTARRCTDNGTWSGTDLVCADHVMKI